MGWGGYYLVSGLSRPHHRKCPPHTTHTHTHTALPAHSALQSHTSAVYVAWGGARAACTLSPPPPQKRETLGLKYSKVILNLVYFKLGIADQAFIWHPKLARALYSWSNGFSSLILTDKNLSVISAAYYTSNKYKLHLGDPAFTWSPLFNPENTVLSI